MQTGGDALFPADLAAEAERVAEGILHELQTQPLTTLERHRLETDLLGIRFVQHLRPLKHSIYLN
ncbi:MAG: hypothetical protein H6740_12450 [Alphaproteobacteria bacterium]|nr:hypothetical protein [Alphaproteobacteria bacterium]